SEATKLALKKLNVEGEVIWTKSGEEVLSVDGLIIPGGESTVIGLLSTYGRALDAVKEKILEEEFPILGTCAGLIIMAKRAYDKIVGQTNQELLGAMDITVERNSFGRQKESFEADLHISVIGEKSFRAVFIRAPSVKEYGSKVEVIAKLEEYIVGVKERNFLGLAFHPELTNDTRVHEYFINLLQEYKR
ncbi:MAG: pyridoxal 5'-phosphate synthase glutaminase subunit PdxT, partial [Candidatus Brockarchaeota archaeon]|nr:pyridoxal 5'-phosphate synthase glutaminase subunit PdxT [Candidatus Brockarchaeota archaeon]